MKESLITTMLMIIAIIHLLPISGFFGASRLEALYGEPINKAALEILMRHRAVLFGILGAFFSYSAFKPELQVLAFIAAFVSIASFFYLTYTIGNFGPKKSSVC